MIVEINRTNVQSSIVDGSAGRYVVVYSFDPEDEKTAALTSSLSVQIGDSESITLAKVNLRETPELSRMLPISALPSLIVIKDGKMVDSLEGDEVYTGVDAFIKKFQPKEDELLYRDAADSLKNEKLDAAMEKIQAAIAINDIALYRLTKAEILIKQNKLEDAESIIGNLSMQEQLDNDDYYKTLLSTLSLAKQAVADSPIEDLKKQAEADPDNLELKVELAVQYNRLNQKTEALDQLYTVLKKDLNYGEAKKTYLDILETMGSSATVSGYRRKLYTLMY
jgi:putative thioredoxin